MLEGTYRVTLIEAATGRRILQRSVKGEAAECPVFGVVDEHEALYSSVDQRQFDDLFRPYVGY